MSSDDRDDREISMFADAMIVMFKDEAIDRVNEMIELKQSVSDVYGEQFWQRLKARIAEIQD